MITPLDGLYSIYCDVPYCAADDELEDAEDFIGAVETAKDRGWKIIPIGDGEYRHHCNTHAYTPALR